MRKIKTFERRTESGTVRKAVVYYHADWQEWFVRFYLDDTYVRKCMYEADGYADAADRAEHFIYLE